MDGRRLCRVAVAAFALTIALGLAACGDPGNVTVHKPGVYKGKPDPLLELQRTPEQQAQLRDRFRKQMDR